MERIGRGGAADGRSWGRVSGTRNIGTVLCSGRDVLEVLRMRLSDFIEQNVEAILEQWESFAATLLPAASGMDSLALRDHAREILRAISADLRMPQSRDEQSEKSKGRAPKLESAAETAAQVHAVLRARGEFDMVQLVAEYRALRASVLRLWMDWREVDAAGVQEMVRFNEAIDQAVAESVGHFHRTVEQYRNLLLGMLGHDMRTPLTAIVMTAAHLGQLNAGEEVSEAAEVLIKSGESMQALLDDLTDFNRTRLGLGMKVEPKELDLSAAVQEELKRLRAAYPQRTIEFSESGVIRGRWDSLRLQQVIRNLVSNAVKYGDGCSPVRVAVRGEDAEVRLEVRNAGRIKEAELRQLFNPLRRGQFGPRKREAGEGLGLGLFIVSEIVKAHGGEVQARSEGGETTFEVSLPRR